MYGKVLKEKLTRGQTVYGTFFQHSVTPAIVDFLPDGALDFVIVSAEHNALDLAEFFPLRYALASKGIACLARGRATPGIARETPQTTSVAARCLSARRPFAGEF